jgi:hypothetical protein
MTRFYCPFFRGKPSRRGVRLAPRSGKKERDGDVFGGTPDTAVGQSEQNKSGPLNGLTAFPIDRISDYSRPFAVLLQFLKVQKQLMQVVDFQDSFRYFWIVLVVLVASIRGSTPVLESSKSPYASR